MGKKQGSDYQVFGMQMPGRNGSANSYDYGFNGMLKDDEIKGESNSYDFGARIYDPRVARWLSRDPYERKYPYESGYNFVGNSPIIYVDPNGKEKIVVTGGEYDGDRYKYNFVEPAIKQLKAYKAKSESEDVAWVIMNIGYSDDDIASFKSTAEEIGVNLVMVNSDDELTNYLNKKRTKQELKLQGSGESPETANSVSSDRTADPITDVTILGHGFVGSFEFGYNQEGSEDFSYGTDDVQNLNPEAFDQESCFIDIYTCNAATPTNGNNESSAKSDLFTSIAGQLSRQTLTTVQAYQGRTDYKFINQGEGYTDKLGRSWNGYNTSGSQNMPKAGTQSNGEKSDRWRFTRNPDN